MKLVHFCRSYRKNRSDLLFWHTVYLHTDAFKKNFKYWPNCYSFDPI